MVAMTSLAVRFSITKRAYAPGGLRTLIQRWPKVQLPIFPDASDGGILKSDGTPILQHCTDRQQSQCKPGGFARNHKSGERFMTADEHDSQNARFLVKVTADSHFSWIRTRLSLERTLMSWARTAVSMIGFGFTIVQFFEHLEGMSDFKQATMPDAPRYLGLGLMAAGILALLISTWQFSRMVAYIHEEPFKPIAGVGDTPMHTPIYAISIALILIGAFAMVAVLTRSI